MRDYAYEAALTFANRIRKEQGKHPLEWLPKGTPSSGDGCPLALAVDRSVSSEVYFDDYAWRDLPRDVSRFVNKFDCGKYPELIA